MRQVIIGKFQGTFDYILYANQQALAPSVSNAHQISKRQKGQTLQQALAAAALQDGYRPMSRTEQIMLLKESIPEKKDLHTEGFFEMLLEWMRLNQKQGIDIPSIQTDDAILQHCIAIVERYTMQREAEKYADDAVYLRQALNQKPPEFGRIAICGITDFSPADVQFLKHLSESNAVTVFLEPIDADAHLAVMIDLFKTHDFQVMTNEPPLPEGRENRAYVAFGKQRLFRTLREVIDQSAESLDNIDVVFANQDDKVDFERFIEMDGVGLHLGLRLPLVQTKIGQTLLSAIQAFMANDAIGLQALTAVDDEAQDAHAAWVDGLMKQWKKHPADALQQILKKAQRSFMPLFSYDSIIEEKAIGRLRTLFDTPRSQLWEKQLKSANAHRFVEGILGEQTIRSPENIHGLRTHTLNDRVFGAKHVIFVGFSKDYPNISVNVLMKKQMGEHDSERWRQAAYARLQYQWRVAYSQAEQTTFVFDGMDEEMHGQSLMSISTLIEPIRAALCWEKVADAWACDYTPRTLPAKQPHLSLTIAQRYSASGVNTFMKCPFKYWIQYVLHPVEEQPSGYALTKGNYMHAVLNSYYTQTGAAINTALDNGQALALEKAQFDFATDNAQALCPEALPFQQAIWNAQVQAYITEDLKRMESIENIRYLSHEQPFESPLKEGSPISIYGRVDRMDTDGESFMVGDYKSGKIKGKSDLEKCKDVQLPFYSLAHKQAAVYYGDLNAAALQMIHGSDQMAGKFDQQEWSTILENVIAQVETMDANIQSGQFRATPGDHCQYCDYAAICRKEVQDESE